MINYNEQIVDNVAIYTIRPKSLNSPNFSKRRKKPLKFECVLSFPKSASSYEDVMSVCDDV